MTVEEKHESHRFRYGFLAQSDSPLLIGSAVMFGLNLVLALICYRAFAKGWKIKA